MKSFHIPNCGKPDAERFWPKVDKNGPGGCWIWKGAMKRGGYGLFAVKDRKKKLIAAHRFSYELVHGRFPEDINPRDHSVCHRCDNPPCVNPAHLFVGTYQDNTNDRVAKKRHHYGERNFHAKLTEVQVLEIRALRGKVTQRELAARYGVKQSTIGHLQAGRSWKHLN